MNAPVAPPLFRTVNRRLLRDHDTAIVWVQRVLDVAVVSGLLAALCWWYFDGKVPASYRHLAGTAVLLMLGIYEQQGVYRRFSGKIEGAKKLAKAWVLLILALTAIGFITKTSETYSRLLMAVWAVCAFCVQFWVHYLTFVSIRRLQKQRAGVPTLVVGTGDLALHLVKALQNNPFMPERVVGVASENSISASGWSHPTVRVLGSTGELDSLVSQYGIRRVYVALPLRLTYLVQPIEHALFAQNLDVIWAPDIQSLRLLNHSVREVAGVPLITLSETPIMSGSRAFIKEAMDRTLGLLALIAFSPIMVATAVAIKLTSPGPVLFKQKRHGWDGREIEVWKFRSMKLHQEHGGSVTQAQRHDPRVTRVGRFIRRTSIDELPQLFNVLQGRMSLVGPRPHALAHNEYYTDKVEAYLQRHRIKPGMTGLAQINGYRGETETLDKMEGRVRFDLEYINNWSPWLDLKILVKTPLKLMSKGIY